MSTRQPLALACVFLWIGSVCAISFLEAWIKFRAPGITLPIGLGIGRLVFAALNRVEWVFAIIVAGSALWQRAELRSFRNGLLLAVIGILALQTAWLLPALDARAELYITGQSVAPSNLHIYFVAAEFLKVALLSSVGILLFRKA